MTSKRDLRIAVDIGGTFTDTVLVDGDNHVLATAKTPTTPSDPTEGALRGFRRVLDQARARATDIAGFIHGTTLATNALIERRTARVVTVTTAGFRDILEIAYERRYSQYDIDLVKPDLMVPRSRSFTVPERVSVTGEIIEPLDESAIDRLLMDLEVCGAEAVAVCLLHAYANSVHEHRLRELLLQRRPELVISLSSDVSPEAREFDRLCTTVANAGIQALMADYLAEFERRFALEGLQCPVLMMTAGGGMTTIDTARRFPIRLVESGPAGGAILAARVAQSVDAAQVLSFDMGGTTAKLCLIDDFRPQTARTFEIGRAARFIRGSGMPVRIPVLEMIEIGAGGGSIAGVDRLGRLQVGPQSAGSEPGPAAFCRGGTNATVTDSDIAIGLIDPEAFAEGRLTCDRNAAEAAIARNVGDKLGLGAVDAAAGISDIVDESMASAGRMHAVESGKDLGERIMIAFGGNGPLHATRVARRAGLSRILIPRDPGVGSAVGFLHAPISFETVRSKHTMLDNLDPDDLNRFFEAMLSQATDVVRAGAPEAELRSSRTAFMRYRGQGHEIEIRLPDRDLVQTDISDLKATFEAEYRRQYARSVPGMPIEILNWAAGVSTVPRNTPGVPEPREAKPVATTRQKSIRCDVTGTDVTADVFKREDLVPGDRLAGPALVVEPQSTTFVSSDFELSVDTDGNLLLSRTGLGGTDA